MELTVANVAYSKIQRLILSNCYFKNNMLQFLQKKSMYVLTLCRDYISVTSNGPCTFPEGEGGVSHYSLFWGLIKDPALVSLGKKSHFRNTNLLSVYASTLQSL